MFTGELVESRQTEVTIRDIDELAMELLIDFCYTSHIVVEESNVQTLLPAGECRTRWPVVGDLGATTSGSIKAVTLRGGIGELGSKGD